MVDAAMVIATLGVYDDGSLAVGLGVSLQTLTRARKDGRLRYTRQGQRTLYLGSWVLDWLAADATPQASEVASA